MHSGFWWQKILTWTLEILLETTVTCSLHGRSMIQKHMHGLVDFLTHGHGPASKPRRQKMPSISGPQCALITVYIDIYRPMCKKIFISLYLSIHLPIYLQDLYNILPYFTRYFWGASISIGSPLRAADFAVDLWNLCGGSCV